MSKKYVGYFQVSYKNNGEKKGSGKVMGLKKREVGKYEMKLFLSDFSEVIG